MFLSFVKLAFQCRIRFENALSKREGGWGELILSGA